MTTIYYGNDGIYEQFVELGASSISYIEGDDRSLYTNYDTEFFVTDDGEGDRSFAARYVKSNQSKANARKKCVSPYVWSRGRCMPPSEAGSTPGEGDNIPVIPTLPGSGDNPNTKPTPTPDSGPNPDMPAAPGMGPNPVIMPTLPGGTHPTHRPPPRPRPGWTPWTGW